MRYVSGVLLGLVAALAWVGDAGAETAVLVDEDGVVHYTNAPNDPRYRRLRGVVEDPVSPTADGSPPAASPAPPAQPARYVTEIGEAARRYGVPERLVQAVIKAESGYKPMAVSRKGARGLMQLMPETAALLGVQNSFDPRENIDGGVRHLRGLLDRYGKNLRLALAAYNAGEQAVDRHGDVPPYPETQQYVARILREYGETPTPEVPQSSFYHYDDGDTVTYTNIRPAGR